MVATSGRGWVLAPAIEALFDEADREYPNRDHASDGTIGDTSHQARKSDHNPDADGYVCAGDLDEDLEPGLDLRGFVERIRARQDGRVAYVIYEGRVFFSYAHNGFPAWAWQPYTGINAHAKHAHISVKHTDPARNNTDKWYVRAPATSFPPVVPPKPKPIAIPGDDKMFFAQRGTADPRVWFFEPGRYTHVTKRSDSDALAAAADISPHEAVLSPAFFDQLAEGRVKHEA